MGLNRIIKILLYFILCFVVSVYVFEKSFLTAIVLFFIVYPSSISLKDEFLNVKKAPKAFYISTVVGCITGLVMIIAGNFFVEMDWLILFGAMLFSITVILLLMNSMNHCIKFLVLKWEQKNFFIRVCIIYGLFQIAVINSIIQAVYFDNFKGNYGLWSASSTFILLGAYLFFFVSIIIRSADTIKYVSVKYVIIQTVDFVLKLIFCNIPVAFQNANISVSFMYYLMGIIFLLDLYLEFVFLFQMKRISDADKNNLKDYTI